MENPAVGYRFCPTKEELVNNYLRPKNGDGDTSHVDRTISTVNICSFDPWKLPFLSMIQSRDKFWYFFGRIEKYRRGGQLVRTTESGFWKKTGKTTKIMSSSGEQIGEKRVLVFYFNKSKTDWVMHEYHLSPLNPMMAYTVCKVKFKGAASEIYSPPGHEIAHSSITDINNNSRGLSSGFEVGQSQNLTAFEEFSFEMPHREETQNPRPFSGLLHLEEEAQLDDAMRKAIDSVPTEEWNSFINDFQGFSFEMPHREETQNPRPFSGLLHLEEEAQYEDAMRKAIDSVPTEEWNSYINDVEQSQIVSMQEDCSRYKPKQHVTGVMVGHNMTYTICKIKGEASDIYSPPGHEITHSSITDINNNNSGGLSSGSEVGQSQNLTPFQGFSSELLPSEESQNPEKKTQFNDDEQSNIVLMQQDCSDSSLEIEWQSDNEEWVIR